MWQQKECHASISRRSRLQTVLYKKGSFCCFFIRAKGKKQEQRRRRQQQQQQQQRSGVTTGTTGVTKCPSFIFHQHQLACPKLRALS
mmetsp:Transcript_725/g.1300  ORF Transcript_725/g.1300 Transcript_725/m.1300 type:complete len:87 (-) Transcript_725:899-1159(-)